ncbi:type II toxin-antitoxin system RelE/ParE family toxin [Altererythrobacter sp. Root672]|uniref:type II toxin-antitoxin system RelE/ParE family toxin n=1 Tax=Altererythrobacter sp. Root672 TaxID=1736584 RepID=UPI0006FCFF4A|nr:hypothetical protein ASD76_16200 [Altererythrobacter sp. Root672]
MQIRYRRSALADLNAIEAFYLEQAPHAIHHVLADIRAAIGILAHFPRVGKRIGQRGLRRILTRRYRYMIAYRAERNEIEIIGIFRFQDREA